MNKQASHYAILAVFATGLSISLLCSLAFAQDPPRERPKLKNFGSSLKRLKWDPKLNATVESQPRKDSANGSNDADVVRVETSLVVSDVLVLDQPGQTVQGLTAKDFVLTEDGKPQEVGTFSLGDSFQGYVSRNPREFSLADVYRAAERSHATIYTVVPGFRLIGLSPEEQTAQTKAYHERQVSYLTVPMIRKHAEDRLKRMPVAD